MLQKSEHTVSLCSNRGVIQLADFSDILKVVSWQKHSPLCSADLAEAVEVHCKCKTICPLHCCFYLTGVWENVFKNKPFFSDVTGICSSLCFSSWPLHAPWKKVIWEMHHLPAKIKLFCRKISRLKLHIKSKWMSIKVSVLWSIFVLLLLRMNLSKAIMEQIKRIEGGITVNVICVGTFC